VFDETACTAIVEPDIVVRIPYPVQRVAGGPRFNTGGHPRFQDIGCVVIPEGLGMHCVEENVDTTYLSRLIGRAYQSIWGIPQLDRLSPLCMDRDHWVMASKLNLKVMKHGASTQRTFGRWIGVADAIPEIGVVWIPGRNFGVVEWLSMDMPFATGGDSGAFVKLWMNNNFLVGCCL
jgi:hypothetical protein